MSSRLLTHTRLGTGQILFTLSLGVLVAQIDTSVVNLAMQQVGATFHAPVAALQWVLDAYNLSYAVLLLTGGLLADVYGRRLVFMAGAAVLTLASFACALAPSAGMLIAARVATGVGAGLLIPASLALVRVVWPDRNARRKALGVWASCNGLAFVIGPTIGGFLIAWLGWRSVFYLSVPIAASAFVMAWAVVPESADPQARRLDLRGQFLGMVVLGGLVWGIISAHEQKRYWYVAIVLAAIALPLFIRTERRAGPEALVPLDVFRQTAFRGAVGATAAMTFGIYGMIFLVPLVWQSSGLLTAEQAGMALLPCALLFFLISPRSGHLAERFGVRLLTAGGTAVIGLGLLVLGASSAGQPLWLAEVGLALTGIGMGLNTGPLMSVSVEAVDAARSGTASSLINVARMTGASLGVAVLGAAFGLAGGGSAGLRAAMLTGGAVQLCGAALAWRSVH
ncbi:MAG: MFS transporter [Rhodopila sp.]